MLAQKRAISVEKSSVRIEKENSLDVSLSDKFFGMPITTIAHNFLLT